MGSRMEGVGWQEACGLGGSGALEVSEKLDDVEVRELEEGGRE